MVQDEVDRIEVLEIKLMLTQNSRGKFALERSEAKTVSSITPQQKLDEPVAQTANAVVENDGMSI